MKRIYVFLSLVLMLVAAVVTVLYLRASSIPILEPAGPIALAERRVILITLALCSTVVIPVFFLLFFFAWKYRADGPEAHLKHDPDWDDDSMAAEFAWWLVPSAIIVALGILMWQSTHALDPFAPIVSATPPITVDVVALDWKWLFIYPAQGVASVNLLEIPENTPIHFYLTADAPMNSFWIPSLGGQIMVMPGMSTQLNLMASRLGDFNGYSANISGKGFSGMAFTARSVSPGDFAAWVASVQASSTPLTLVAYAALAQPSSYVPIAQYAPVDSGLYTTVIDNIMLPHTMAGGVNALPPGTSAPYPVSAPLPAAMTGTPPPVGMHIGTTTP